MPKLIPMIGLRFGRLVVLGDAGTVNEKRRYIVVCDCGTATIVAGGNLRSSHTRSCGCLKVETSHTTPLRHGDAVGYKKTVEYTLWRAMRQRCLDPSQAGFPRYGGRGIKVCPQWDDFAAFLEYMGRRPAPHLTVERIDNDGNYEPGNVKWATRSEQNSNQGPRRKSNKPPWNKGLKGYKRKHKGGANVARSD